MAVSLGLVGRTLAHSLSPAIARVFFAQTGIDGDYCRFEIERDEEFDRFVACALREGPLRGLNVTIPYKERAAALCDRLSEDAALTGAVNTLVKEGGTLRGENTDVEGFEKSLAPRLGTDLSGTAVVAGAGGAARAAVVALGRLGFREVILFNRTARRAARLAEELSARCGVSIVVARDASELAAAVRESGVRLLVNATPVGMVGHEEGVPIPLEALDLMAGGGIVFDLIYNPPETKLLREARARSIETLNGLEMLVLQAARSFELWTGVRPDAEEALRVVREAQA